MKTTHILPILLSVVICSTSFGRGNDTTKKSKVVTKSVVKSQTKSSKNCGFIVDQGVDTITEVYWVDVKNDSTGNVRKFELSRDKWFSINMDAKFCVDSVKVW